MQEPAIVPCLVTLCTCTICGKGFAIHSNVSELIIAVKDTLEKSVTNYIIVSLVNLLRLLLITPLQDKLFDVDFRHVTHACDDDERHHTHEIKDINQTLDQVIEVDTLGALELSRRSAQARIAPLDHMLALHLSNDW